MIIPIIASFAGAFSQVIDKIALSKDKINYKSLSVLSFFIISVILFICSPLFFNIPKGFFQPIMILYFLAVVIVAAAWNLLQFYGLSHDKLTEFEPIFNTAPLFSVLLAFFLFEDERNAIIVIASIIAGLALLIGQIEKRHFKFNKYSLAIICAAFLIATENMLIKRLLDIFDPVNLYFLRVVAIFLIFQLLLRPWVKNLKNKRIGNVIAAKILVTIQALFIFWSFKVHGIIFTVLILNLIPVIVYLVSVLLLKEKMSAKNIICAAIILLCVLSVQIL